MTKRKITTRVVVDGNVDHTFTLMRQVYIDDRGEYVNCNRNRKYIANDSFDIVYTTGKSLTVQWRERWNRMNKRIIELGLKAHLLNYIDNETPPNYFVSGYADQQEVIDFAQFIIQECVAIADHSVENGKSIIGERIKQHFGIEE